MKGKDGTIVSGTMPLNAAVLTRTMSIAPILTCSMVSFRSQANCRQNLDLVLAGSGFIELFTHVLDGHVRRELFGVHIRRAEITGKGLTRGNTQCGRCNQGQQGCFWIFMSSLRVIWRFRQSLDAGLCNKDSAV